MIGRAVAIAAGVWLVVAPAVLDHNEPAADNDRAIGPIIASLAFVALWPLGRPLRWATLPLGVWLALAPLVIDYHSTAAALSALVAGLIVAAGAPQDGTTTHRFGGGWRGLVRSPRNHPARLSCLSFQQRPRG